MVLGDEGEEGGGAAGLILPAGVAVGGYFLAKKGLFGSKQAEINRYKEVTKKAAGDFEEEVNNAGNIPESELKTHIAEYKSKAKVLNDQLESGGVDIQGIKQELKGQDLETKALRWKQTVMLLGQENITETAGESAALRILDEITKDIPWFDAFMHITVAGTTVAVLARLIRFGGGGGGLMENLTSLKDWVTNGIYGAKDYLEDINLPPNPSGIPVGYPPSDTDDPVTSPTPAPYPAPDPEPVTEPTVTGTPRGSFQVLGVAEDIASKILTLAGVQATATIELGADSLEAIADATGTSVTWLTNNPAKAILIALAIVAAAAMVTGDGPLPFGDGAAYGLLQTVSRITGVSMPSSGSVPSVASAIAI